MISLRLFDQSEILEARPQLVAVYSAAFAEPPYNKTTAEATSFGRWLPDHLQRPHFRCAVAQLEETSELVGFAYGYTSRPQNLWHAEVEKLLGPNAAVLWLADCFQFAEFAVHPTQQGRGLGGRLHDLLLQDLPHTTAMLSTMQADTAAYRLYQKRGWQSLLTNHTFPGVERPYQTLGLNLSANFSE